MQQLEMGLGGGEDLGAPVTEPGIDGSAVEADGSSMEMPKGGEI